MKIMSDVYQKLEKIVSKAFISNDLYVRHAYSRNVNPVLQGVPDIVIRPSDAEEISEILKIANKENFPVIPRGGGFGADILTTSCPFCISNLQDAYDEMGKEVKEKLLVIDIIDLIASRI